MISRLAPIILALTFSLAGCRVGPDYERPPATESAMPEQYKAEALGSWKEGEPLDHVPKGEWWRIFGDPLLDDLELRAAAANQGLKAAVARVDQARAAAGFARGELWPAISADPLLVRQRFSPNQEPNLGGITANTFIAPIDLSYEIDLWGRIRRGAEGAHADAEASLAALHNVLLTLNAEVARNYFDLRALDAEVATVTGTVALRERQVELVRGRFDAGMGDELDVARAETELASAQTELAALDKLRAELENALAILAGENPASFTLAAARGDEAVNWRPAPPEIPAGLPSGLLERRPDVSEAERELAAANARIGVAKAAFFPSLTLTGSAGYVSSEVDELFNWNSRAWSIGPSLSLPIFTGGRNLANYDRANALYDESIALYRERVLVAFGDVENSLAGIRYLADQFAAQERAVVNARRAANLAGERYRAGLVSYLEVVDADREALQAERGRAKLSGERLVASVLLIKALGGGWRVDELAAKD